MKVLVFTAAFYDRDFDESTRMLKKSADHNKIDLKMYGVGERFSFYESKIDKMGVFLNNHKDTYTHALYTDASDSIILSSMDEIIEKYNTFTFPLVTSAEKSIYPFPQYGYLFPDGGTPWRYMNPGNFMGEISYILHVINQLKTYAHLQANDQGHWMMAWKDGKIAPALDYRCELFQTMSLAEPQEFSFDSSTGRVLNVVTGEMPCIVHFNGPKTGLIGDVRNEFYKEMEAYYEGH